MWPNKQHYVCPAQLLKQLRNKKRKLDGVNIVTFFECVRNIDQGIMLLSMGEVT